VFLQQFVKKGLLGFIALTLNSGKYHKLKGYFFFFTPELGPELRAYTLSHSTRPPPFFLWWVFFEIGSHELFAWAGFEWLWTLILLISASWGVGTIGMSHWCLAKRVLLNDCMGCTDMEACLWYDGNIHRRGTMWHIIVWKKLRYVYVYIYAYVCV
jgi:hypothetical protein